MSCDDNTYRIHIVGDEGPVTVVCFGMNAIDSTLEGTYDNLSSLPDWVQRKVAVLSMTSPEPPPQDVDGIGVRIDQHTYWIYHN